MAQGSKNRPAEAWLPVRNITSGMIVLDNNEKVTGVKITPKNIRANSSTKAINISSFGKRPDDVQLINMEIINDWGYDEREYITEKEASEYSQILMQRIIDNWYL